ncbi:MAG: hypothetical protein OXH68_03775 [Gammaproteobacteria bacterium]|nr:hypothetical protein [Gammaproteobacteria bacterium]
MDFSFFRDTGRALCRLAGRIKSYVADSRAVSTVEYALITVAVVAIVGGAAVFLDDAVDTLFGSLEDQMVEQDTAAEGLDDQPT